MNTQLYDHSQRQCIADLEDIEWALNISIVSTLSGALSGFVNEESTTGSLLGAISSNIYWIRSLTEDSIPKLHWTQYKKSGKDLSSETWTGSDFSLIIRIEDEQFRIATFQAKRAKNSENAFNSVQISPLRKPFRPEPQLIRMLRHGSNYLQILNIDDVIDRATWLHFLVYASDKIVHMPLSMMSAHCRSMYAFDQQIKKLEDDYHLNSGELFDVDEIKRRWRNFSPHVIAPKISRNFFQLILSATRTPREADAPGWRTIRGRGPAEAFIEATAPHHPVFEAAAGASYSPIISHSDSVSVLQIEGLGVPEILAKIQSRNATSAQRQTGIVPARDRKP